MATFPCSILGKPHALSVAPYAPWLGSTCGLFYHSMSMLMCAEAVAVVVLWCCGARARV